MRAPAFRRSIFAKFLLILAPALLLAMGLASYCIAQFQIAAARDQFAARTGGQIGRVASLVSQTDIAQDPAAANRLLSILLFDRAILCAEAVENDRPVTGVAVPRRVGCSVAGIDEYLSVPIPDTNYELRAGLSRQEIVQVRTDTRRTVFSLAALCLLYVGIAAFVAFRRVVGKPVGELLSVIRLTTSTGRHATIAKPHDDQIGDVMKAFNAMQLRLESESAQVRDAHEQIERLYNSTPAMLFALDSAGLILSVSTYWLEMTGYTRGDVIAKPLVRFIAEASQAVWRKDILLALNSGGDVRDAPLRILDADGAEIDVTFSATAHRGQSGTCEFVCVMTDVRRLKTIERELRAQATTDSLTGLANRARLDDRMRELIDEQRRALRLSAALMIDLDGFKHINDTHGHAAGDLLLRESAHRIRAAARPQDFVARLGGDEFAIICEGISKGEAEALADRLVAAFARPFDLQGATERVGASIGVAILADTSIGAAELLRRADRAMYAVKHAGKGGYAIFDPRAATRDAAA